MYVIYTYIYIFLYFDFFLHKQWIYCRGVNSLFDCFIFCCIHWSFYTKRCRNPDRLIVISCPFLFETAIFLDLIKSNSRCFRWDASGHGWSTYCILAPTFVIDSRWSMVYHSFLVNSISGVSCLFSCSAGPGSSACRAAAGFEEGIGRTPGAAGWPARGGSHGGGALAEQGPCPHWTSLSGRRQRAGLGPPCLLVRRGVGAERRGLVSFATAAVFCFLPWLRSGWWLRSTTYKYRTHRTPRIWIAIGLEHNRRLLEPYF